MTIYTGSGSVVAPAGAVAASIEAFGDGGGGASAANFASVFVCGGGGAYAANLLFSVVGGSTVLFYNVGAGGPGGTTGAGISGTGAWISTTGFRPLNTSQGVFAPGGGGGTNSLGSGVGGLVSSAIGIVKFAGGNGNVAFPWVGGGGAGSSGAGLNGSSGGVGGSPDGGNGDTGAGASSPGGGGASGAVGSGYGRAGASGQVRITFFFSQPLFANARFGVFGRGSARSTAPTYTQYSYTQNIPVVSTQISFASQLNAALASVQAALATVPVLRDATLVQLAPISLAVSNALSTFTGIASVLDSQISTTKVAGIVPGVPAPQIVETFLSQVSAVEQLSVLLNAAAVLGRIQINLEQATG